MSTYMQRINRRKVLHDLQYYQLLRYCQKWGLDPAEIDQSINYAENKEHLKEIVKMLQQSLDMFEIERMGEEAEHYYKEHPLEVYMASEMYGDTKSAEVGEPDKSPSTFSLKAYVKGTDVSTSAFSLKALVVQSNL